MYVCLFLFHRYSNVQNMLENIVDEAHLRNSTAADQDAGPGVVQSLIN